MSATVPGHVLTFLAELEEATTEIIERHYAADEKRKEPSLIHYGPFEVRVYGCNGHLARFLEEGIEMYPEDPTA